MELSKLTKNFDVYTLGEDKEISGLCCNSKEVKANDLFFCINGTHTDGHKFALDAVKNGAVAVVCEKELDLPKQVTQIIVPSSRKAMGEFASEFYGNPQKNMKVIMVTGTNGKTTTTYLLKKVLEDAGFSVGLIGTNGTLIGNKHINSNLTTPDPIELFGILRQMEKNGCDFVCMEASAHALYLDKLSGLKADISILTNITQDHLDFFRTMENYVKAKRKLFEPESSRFCVINTDNSLAKSIFENCAIPAISVGTSKDADINAFDIAQNRVGQSFTANFVGELQNFNLKLDGKFNVSNALGVIAVAELLGLDQKQVSKSLSSVEPIPGRFNKIDKNGVSVIIDYAHTPDGIQNILTATREIAKKGKVIAVFGCGGNRDAAKRPIMGQIACNLADCVVITSDNPRYEDPEAIIANICKDISGYTNYICEPDRSKAIKKALSLAKSGDVVAILGKGNENYLDVCGKKIPYSDQEEVEKI